MAHWLKHFRKNAPATPNQRGQGITVNPHNIHDVHASQQQRAERNQRIRALAAQGISRAEIAEQVGIAASTVGRILRVPNL